MNLRYEILKAVACNPGSTITEIADAIKYDRTKAAWAVRDCAKDGLLSKRLDDVTRQPGYLLTATGKNRLAEGPGRQTGKNQRRGDSEGGETDAPAVTCEQRNVEATAQEPLHAAQPAEIAPAEQAQEVAPPSDGYLLSVIQSIRQAVGDDVSMLDDLPGAIRERIEQLEASNRVRAENSIWLAKMIEEQADELRRHADHINEATSVVGKYHREIRPGIWIDVYDVLRAWRVTNPALAHLIKKALQPGERGHKTLEQDLNDIIVSANRAKELEQAAYGDGR